MAYNSYTTGLYLRVDDFSIVLLEKNRSGDLFQLPAAFFQREGMVKPKEDLFDMVDMS
jgi:hypothetical protein